MKENKLVFIIFLVFIITINLSGCYSYFEISKEDYANNEKLNKTKIVLNTKEEIIVEEPQKIRISDEGNIIITKDTSVINIPFSNVDRIMEEKFNFGKTFFSTFWYSLLGFIVICLIFIISFGPITFN